MELILNACLGAGLLLFLVLLFKKGKTNGDYFFLLWIATVLLQITFYQITIYFFELEGLLAITGFALPLLGAPLLFLYITFLTGNSLTWRTWFFYTSAFILLYVTCFFCISTTFEVIILIADQWVFTLASRQMHPFGFSIMLYPWPFLVLCTAFGGCFLLKRHQKDHW